MGYGFPGVGKPFFRDRMVCLVDRANSRLRGGRLTLDDLRILPHAIASFGRGQPHARRPGPRRTGRRPQGRHRRERLPATSARRRGHRHGRGPARATGRLHDGYGGLTMVEPPFGYVVLAEGYYYAQHREADTAYRWFFDRLDEVAAVIGP